MKYLWIFAIFGGLFFSSCQEETTMGTTPSGFKYEHHVKNESAKPQKGEYAYFHVQMRNPMTGDVTYNSHDAPQMPKVAIPDFSKNPPGQKPSPVVEALSIMATGDSLTIFQSLDSIPRKPQGYEEASDVAYDIVLVSIKSQEEYKAEMDVEQKKAAEQRSVLTARISEIAEQVTQTATAYTAGKLDGDIKTTASGLKYLIHEEGTGAVPKSGEPISTHYYGTLTDGTMFDNSFQRGKTFDFPVGQGRVIKGWDEGFGMFKEGTKATLFIPANLGYGAAGSPPKIPGGSELIFYVELEKVGK